MKKQSVNPGYGKSVATAGYFTPIMLRPFVYKY